MIKSCVVIGAGLTGASAAWKLRQAGWHVVVLESREDVGGNCRTGTLMDFTYEKCGPHIFHTNDQQVAEFVKPWLLPYTHTVSSHTKAGIFSWPIQLGEVCRLSSYPTVARELAARPESLPDPRETSFRDYVVALMGETLYELFIDGYTRKQWDQDPGTLSAIFAPKRVELRSDGFLPLFRDRYQGWLKATSLIRYLLRGCEIHLGKQATYRWLRVNQPCVVTAPLDQFMLSSKTLWWRGSRFVHKLDPDGSAGIPPMKTPVMNYPQLETHYIRRTETPMMTGELCPGRLVTYEFAGGGENAYPVNDVDGKNRTAQLELEAEFRQALPLGVAAGRMARYVYIDMDQSIRQGWNAAAEIVRKADR